MRKETSNTWSDGLVMDLNPLNTPNTVLSDCLNGTLITYNGNEFHLQNDQGNYKLKHCKLKPNYIPVGLKEYGDILYIVSYNPLEKTVEVGSYPSPLMISTSEFEPNDQKFGSVIQKFLPTSEPLRYSELVEKEDFMIFNGDEYKLFPGDKYHIQVIDYTTFYKYETFDCYVLDEESNTHEIPDNQIVNSDCTVEPLDEDYNYVSWTVPGWITLKSRIAKLTSSDINIRSFYAPMEEGSRTGYFNWTFKVNIDDPIFFEKEIISEENPILRDLAFKLEIKKNSILIYDSVIKLEEVSENNSDLISLTAGEFGSTDWYGNNRIIWKNISGNIPGLKDTDILTVTMTPMLTDENYSILYDNVSQTKIFDLSEIDNIPWSFGETLYRFYHDADNTHQIIEFDINGPMVSSSEIKFSYSVFEVGSNKKSIVPTTMLQSHFGIGNNIISFALPKDKEEIWIFRFKFSGTNYSKTEDRYLISTQLLNGSEEWTVFDKEMSLDYLVNRYFDNISLNPVIKEADFSTIYWQDDPKITFTYDNELKDEFSSFLNIENKYYSFVPAYAEFDGKRLQGRVGMNVNVNANINSGISRLEGNLWNSLLTENFAIKPSNKLIFNELSPDVNGNCELFLYSYKNFVATINPVGSPFNFINIAEDKLYNLGFTVKTVKLGFNRDSVMFTFSGDWFETFGVDFVWKGLEKLFRDCDNSFEKLPCILLEMENNCYYLTPNQDKEPIEIECTRAIIFPPSIASPKNITELSIMFAKGIVEVGLASARELLSNLLIVTDKTSSWQEYNAYSLGSSQLDETISSDYLFKQSCSVNQNWIYKGRKMNSNNVSIWQVFPKYTTCVMLSDDYTNVKIKETLQQPIFENQLLTNKIQSSVDTFLNSYSKEKISQMRSNWVSSTLYLSHNGPEATRSYVYGVYCLSPENKKLVELANLLNTAYITQIHEGGEYRLTYYEVPTLIGELRVGGEDGSFLDTIAQIFGTVDEYIQVGTLIQLE